MDKEKIIDYYQIPSLENVYLEDSFLLDVQERNKEIVMRMEIVLTEHHVL